MDDADADGEPAAAPKAKARGRPKGRGKAKAKAKSVAPEPVASEKDAADEPDQDGDTSEAAEPMDKTSLEKPEKVPTDLDCGDAGEVAPLKSEKRPRRKQASASKAASAQQAESVGNEEQEVVKPKRKRAKKAEVSEAGADENPLPAAAAEVEDALPTSAPSKATRKRKAVADKGHEKMKEEGHEKKEVRSTKGASKDSSKEGKEGKESKEKKGTQTFARRVQPRSKFGMAKWAALRRAFVQFIKPAVPFPSKHEDIWEKWGAVVGCIDFMSETLRYHLLFDFEFCLHQMYQPMASTVLTLRTGYFQHKPDGSIF